MTQPARIQLRRTKGWRMPENTVRVCRPGRWGNRFKIGEQAHHFTGDERIFEVVAIDSQATAVRLYRAWLDINLAQHPKIMRGALDELRGKNLACWCAPGTPCHADVLLELANASPAVRDGGEG